MKGEDTLQSLLSLKEEEIQQLKCDHENLKSAFQQDKINLQSNYTEECKLLGEQYQNQVETLKKEHYTAIEALKKELNEANKKNDDLGRIVRTKIKVSKEKQTEIHTLQEEKQKLDRAR